MGKRGIQNFRLTLNPEKGEVREGKGKKGQVLSI